MLRRRAGGRRARAAPLLVSVARRVAIGGVGAPLRVKVQLLVRQVASGAAARRGGEARRRVLFGRRAGYVARTNAAPAG